MIYALIFGLLSIINVLFIIFSKRKKKYSLYASKIFIVIFVSYWAYYIFILQFGKSPQPQTLAKTTIIKGKVISSATNNSYPVYDKTREMAVKKHLRILDYFLNTAIFQAIIVMLFSIIGLISISNRDKYYKSTLIIHSLLLSLCIIIKYVGIT